MENQELDDLLEKYKLLDKLENFKTAVIIFIILQIVVIVVIILHGRRVNRIMRENKKNYENEDYRLEDLNSEDEIDE